MHTLRVMNANRVECLYSGERNVEAIRRTLGEYPFTLFMVQAYDGLWLPARDREQYERGERSAVAWNYYP